jgi:tetratricopeptide (TPR) repeat protein
MKRAIAAKFAAACVAAVALSACLTACASSRPGEVSSEELYAIGMAYYEIGKYTEAEKWLSRASAMDKTQSASEYQLGRLAYENGYYSQAVKYFDNILKKDPKNIMALKASAFSHIKTGDLAGARKLYAQVLEQAPESADDGYNYALVLYTMDEYAESETILRKYAYALPENKDNLLLLARTQKAQKKPEAIDNYDLWLQKNNDPQVRYEYAELLEADALFARALEEYRAAHDALTTDTEKLAKKDLSFATARVLMLADNTSEDGRTELHKAVEEGFTNKEALEELYKDERIGADNKVAIRAIIDVDLAPKPKEGEETPAADGSTGTTSDGTTASTGTTGGT